MSYHTVTIICVHAVPSGGALGSAGGVFPAACDGDGGEDGESPEMCESGEGAADTSSSVGDEAAERVDDENDVMAGISSSAEGGEQEQEQVEGDCFVRIHNATTGRDLQVTDTTDRQTDGWMGGCTLPFI